MPKRNMRVQQALAALRPFAEEYAMLKRNFYDDGYDLIARQKGNVLGHSGVQIEEIKNAHDTYIALGGKLRL